MTFDGGFVCRLKDSTVYTLKIAQKDDKTYVTCEAEFTDKTPVLISIKAQPQEELKKKEAKLLAKENTLIFTRKHQGWVYEISEWKAKNLTKELSDLIEDEEKPKEEDKVEDPNSIKPDETAAPPLEPSNAGSHSKPAVGGLMR